MTSVDGAVLSEVDRFARRAIDPRAARPEAPMDREALAAVLREAEAIGLLAEEEPSGLGLWEELDRGRAPATTVAVLRRLGRSNAAVALALHMRALGRAACRDERLEGEPLEREVVAAPEGALRLGRTALPRLLAVAALDDDDREVLEAAYAPDAARIVAFDDAAHLVTPTLEDGALRLQRHRREDLRVERRPGAHGLDELPCALVTPIARGALLPVDPVPFLAAHQLALVAIASGALAAAHAQARGYARERRQGGCTLDRHAAVLLLLADARAALDATDAALDTLAARALDAEQLFAAIRLRATAHPALAAGAHAALQVFGGLGYMQDVGLEKRARDVNHLRALAGAPPELALAAAEWERLHD